MADEEKRRTVRPDDERVARDLLVAYLSHQGITLRTPSPSETHGSVLGDVLGDAYAALLRKVQAVSRE